MFSVVFMHTPVPLLDARVKNRMGGVERRWRPSSLGLTLFIPAEQAWKAGSKDEAAMRERNRSDAQAVFRNVTRFPSDFAFQLTAEEFADLRFQIGTSSSPGGRRYLPWVFTAHGAIMAATILSSERAVAMSVYVVRAFVKMRRELLADATLEARLQKIEKALLSHDSALRDVIQKLRPLLLPPPDAPKPRIGFHRDEDKS